MSTKKITSSNRQSIIQPRAFISAKFLILGVLCSGTSVFFQQNSFAQCMTSTQQHMAEQMTLDMGRLHINPNLPVGAIIAEKDIFIPQQMDWRACAGQGHITARIPHAQPSGYDATIYRSNIEGIGLRLSLVNAEKSYNLADANISFDPAALQNAMLRVSLVKTSAYTGTGYLTAGSYLSLYHVDHTGQQRAILNVNLMAQHNSIQNASCDIDEHDRILSINLAPVSYQPSHRVGTVLAEKTFQIKLNCVQNSMHTQAAHLKFYYQADLDAGSQGVIANKIGRAYAQGVGIQLQHADTQQAILSGDKLPIAITPQARSQPMLSINARYYQTTAQVRAGLVYAIATFQIDYP